MNNLDQNEKQVYESPVVDIEYVETDVITSSDNEWGMGSLPIG